MRDQRRTEANVLGYRIECVRTFDERGELAARWYEVLAPESRELLGTFAHRAEAERDIVMRELASIAA
ncbi:MAG TPA: hypothetical protein VFS55_11870 [Dokdonella sp.]|nr:hypothetical protein [Dokdonella sp.]